MNFLKNKGYNEIKIYTRKENSNSLESYFKSYKKKTKTIWQNATKIIALSCNHSMTLFIMNFCNKAIIELKRIAMSMVLHC